jgi:hypothetical protein
MSIYDEMTIVKDYLEDEEQPKKRLTQTSVTESRMSTYDEMTLTEVEVLDGSNVTVEEEEIIVEEEVYEEEIIEEEDSEEDFTLDLRHRSMMQRVSDLSIDFEAWASQGDLDDDFDEEGNSLPNDKDGYRIKFKKGSFRSSIESRASTRLSQGSAISSSSTRSSGSTKRIPVRSSMYAKPLPMVTEGYLDDVSDAEGNENNY